MNRLLTKTTIKNIHNVINRDALLFNKNKIINICKNGITDWDLYVSFNPDKYMKTLVYRNNIYDIYVISWNKNQESPIHDHPDKGCIMTILDGNIEELLYDNELNLIKTLEYKAGDVTYIDNNIGFHKMKTIDKCITLHIYSPPLYSMNIYNSI